jgi:hypothetical protein
VDYSEGGGRPSWKKAVVCNVWLDTCLLLFSIDWRYGVVEARHNHSAIRQCETSLSR